MPEKFNELLLKQDIIELYNAGITPDYGYLMNGRFEKDMVKTVYPLKTLSGNPISWEASDTEYLFPIVSLEPKQEGTGDPSPENVRPISGWDSVQVTRCGKNLLNGECVAATLFNKGGTPGLTNANGTTISGFDVSNLPIHVEQTLLGAPGDDGSFKNGYFSIKTPQEIPDDTEMTISLRIRVTSALSHELNHWTALLKGVEAVSPKIPVNPTSQEVQTITLSFKYSDMIAVPPEKRLKQLEFRIAGMSFDILEIQLEVGSTSTPYEPYQPGTTAQLSLPETIYGGTVDAVTGVGGCTKKVIVIDGETIKLTATYNNVNWVTQYNTTPGVEGGAKAKLISSIAPSSALVSNLEYHFVGFRSNWATRYFTNVDELNSFCKTQYEAGTPVTICYKLATPEPFQATGNQALTIQPGNHTIYTDGNNISLSRKARRLEV